MFEKHCILLFLFESFLHKGQNTVHYIYEIAFAVLRLSCNVHYTIGSLGLFWQLSQSTRSKESAIRTDVFRLVAAPAGSEGGENENHEQKEYHQVSDADDHVNTISGKLQFLSFCPICRIVCLFRLKRRWSIYLGRYVERAQVHFSAKFTL